MTRQTVIETLWRRTFNVTNYAEGEPDMAPKNLSLRRQQFQRICFVFTTEEERRLHHLVRNIGFVLLLLGNTAVLSFTATYVSELWRWFGNGLQRRADHYDSCVT